MAYVKLDCGILDSTLWIERECREIFITALLMAKPREFKEPISQIEVDSIKETGWAAPPGWYGFVEAAGPGIVRRAGVEAGAGLEALRRLGEPDHESRTPDHDGRRMIRCDGGYLILNFDRYREKDHTAADRARRFRDKQRAERNAVASRDDNVRTPTVTEAVSSKQEAVKVKDTVGLKPDGAAMRDEARAILAFLNEKAGRNYQPTDTNLKFVLARFREGYTPVQCRQVVAKKCREWLPKEDMREYLRPSTLFCAEKFNQYVGELVVLKEESHG